MKEMRHAATRFLSHLSSIMYLCACTPTPCDVVPTDDPLVTYPDYQDVSLPCNIAPLNFMMRDETVDALAVEVTDADGRTELSIHARGRKAVWDADAWRHLLTTHTGDSLHVTVTACSDGQWRRYRTFGWYVSPDSIDSYLTYRLIEPGYEVWDNVCIEERCLETFDTRLLADGRQLGNRCMNCHTHGGPHGEYSFFHLRGEKGGTLLSRDGRLRKLTLRKAGMQSGAVYGDLHPTGRYGVFSTNIIIPAFHSQANRRLEVYDTTSDLCVADFDRDSLLLISDNPAMLNTFPCFSGDGRWVYYCAAKNPCGDTIPTAADMLDEVKNLHYSLYRLPFEPATGRVDPDSQEMVYDAQREGGSANFPKGSPDGRMICFTLSASGTFPIWHREARLWLIRDGELIATGQQGTYHSWSHNSRWLAFASKREDGQYGRAYFMHIDAAGHCTKPFVLPQADPEHDDMNLRSYNIPDLSTIAMPFGQNETKLMLEEVKAEAFH